MQSPPTTCVSSLSDASASDLGGDILGPVVVANTPESKASNPPECKGVPLFETGDGDMQLSVNGTSFETHRYLIKRFRGLRLLLEMNPLKISIQRDDVSARDFCETFKVLYTSVVAAPFVFSSRTLISALRVATVFEYYALREYCIQYLETIELSTVKRIEIAREFKLASWEEQAYYDLGMRDEPVTAGEANTIGLDAFVRIAEIREREQRRRGKEVDAAARGQSPRVEGEYQKIIPHATPTHSHLPPHDDKPETDNTVTYVDDSATELDPSFADITLSGVYDFRPEYDYRVEIPRCKCRFINEGKVEERKCAELPCTIATFKHIQARQLAHANRISELELTVKQLNASITAKFTSSFPKAQSTALKFGPELSPIIRPIHKIRPAGLLMPAFPKLRGWGQ